MKVLLKIAARNLLRNKRRSTITFVAIGLGLVLVLLFYGFIQGVDKQFTDDFIKAQTGHIQLHAKGYHEKARLMPLDIAIEDVENVTLRLQELAGMRSVAPRIRFPVIVSTGAESIGVLGLGIDPHAEREGIVATKIAQGRYLSGERGYALIGTKLADDLGIKLGDLLTLMATTARGALNAIDVEVGGLFTTGYSQYDDSILVLSLADAQRLLRMSGQATEIMLMLESADQTERIAQRIQQSFHDDGLEVKTWQELGAAIFSLLETRRQFMAIISMVVILIAALGIVNTMLMSVFERIREIGTLMALGMTPGEIRLLFLLESAILGTAGGLVGTTVGGALLKYLSVVGVTFTQASQFWNLPMGTTFYAEFSWGALGLFFLFAQTVAILAALYPAYIASQQESVRALRHV
ncbi:ABC transporter permease [Candidatus Acetothermia bacterium]|nr:ABC transporter permease [Candidatus Acetothermia bacterium]MCI2431129.1 ABC transporter permease [Candidatus Acetothermia bacterium]MCI2436019.1 ABC transporter permease [Candidatus Acetothermia bacterium]